MNGLKKASLPISAASTRSTVIRLATLGVLAAGAGCGPFVPGTSVPNDALPIGSIAYQGQFSGLNGKTVTGAAVIYRLTADNSYIVRLEGITTPDEAALLVVGTANGATVLQTGLRAHSGTQNYTTGISDTRVWNSITIRSSSNAQTPDYGTALLQAP